MTDFNLKRSALWSIAEVATSGVALFILYKYVLASLGMRSLGIWSLVLATTSLARLGDVGASAGLARFVAEALADKNVIKARDFVETALCTNIAIYTIASIILTIPLSVGVKLLVPADSALEAASLIPYALASFALLNVNAVILSALVGAQRADLKSKIVLLSTVAQVATALICVPSFGLIGMGLGQIAQSAVSIAIAWLTFRKLVGTNLVPFFPRHFDLGIFRELFSFGMKLQFANLISFSFEPATKLAMSSACGLEVLAIFEMAYRLVLQARHLVVAPMQALLPAFAHLGQERPHEVAALYEKTLAKSALFAVTALLSTGAFSPLISHLWLGSYNGLFVTFTVLLSVGWLLNALGAPAYHLGLARGLVKWNLAGHLITTIGSPLLGYLFGRLFGPTAFVLMTSAALGLGAVLTTVLNCRDCLVGLSPSISRALKIILEEFRTQNETLRHRLRLLSRARL
ncbi:oligosaccharide flippase family protein [Bradyrhizobium lupini]|uniref:oligosaccharide flippase family protein n=1 Tax=Rhizobium lupini TaxID=136996 RepID=UPI0034C61A14